MVIKVLTALFWASIDFEDEDEDEALMVARPLGRAVDRGWDWLDDINGDGASNVDLDADPTLSSGSDSGSSCRDLRVSKNGLVDGRLLPRLLSVTDRARLAGPLDDEVTAVDGDKNGELLSCACA